jgi:putative molybdopterin biosynthesis protein
VRFANRQRGAGTRVLLDYHLDKQGIAAGNIQGYNLFEYTHLAVAAAVASGRADCGLGIAAAAQALGLDFIPLFEERYDLVIPEEHYRSSLLAPLLASFQDQELRKQIEKLPGYDIKRMGELIEVAE